MLDVIGAGATAVSTTDWYNVWKCSPEAAQLQDYINDLHEQGRSHPRQLNDRYSVFATSWSHQFIALTHRNFQAYWRNPTYIRAKFLLNIAGGLLVGFTFFQATDSLQGTQNKLFVSILLLRLIIFSLLSSQSSSPLCSVLPSSISSWPSTSKFVQCTRYVNVLVECTIGLLSSCPSLSLSFLGT